MSKNNVINLKDPSLSTTDPLMELLRQGARELIEQAIESVLEIHFNKCVDRKTGEGHAAVVRNGYLPERQLQTGIGSVTVKIPKIRSKDGYPATCRSALVPPYVRKTQSLEAALPWLYLKVIPTGEMADALKILVEPSAKGLSASTVSRLKNCVG